MHPRTPTVRLGRALPALMLAPALALGVLTNVSVATAQARGGDALRDAAPADAYMYLYSGYQGRSPLVDAYVDEVLQAVLDARFDQLALDVLAVALDPDELQAAQGVHAEVSRLLGELPWDALAESDFLMARGFVTNEHERSMQDSILLGLQLPPGRGAEMHAGVRNLFTGVLQMIGTDEVALRATVGRGAGSRQYVETDELPGAAALAADGQPVSYSLMVNKVSWHKGTGDQWTSSSALTETGVKLAFHGDAMLLGISPGAEVTYLDRALGQLAGEGGPRLTDSPRFRRAVAALPADGYELFYMDFPNMFRPMLDFGTKMVESEASPQEAFYIKAIMKECEDLIAPLGALAAMSVVRDETHVVNEGIFLYEDVPSAKDSPFRLMAVGAMRGDPELLSAVPADATAFHAYTGLDLGPMHDWLIERVRKFVPESEKVMAAYDAAQGVLGLDIRDDLLMLLGSGMTTVTFPARRPTATHSEDTVVVGRPRDPAAAKAMNKRLMRIVRAGGAFQGELNMLIDELERGFPPIKMAGLAVELVDAPEAFPGMLRLSVSAFGQHHLYFGMVGDQWMASSTPEALHYVLETMSGEHDDIRSNPAFAALAELPDDVVWSVKLADYSNMGRDIQQALAAVQGVMPMVVMGVSDGDEQAGQALSTALGVLPKISEIAGHLDFMGRSVYWSQVAEDGMSERFHTVWEYKRPEERPSFSRR